MIPYGRQDITEADIEAVIEVLRSDFVTQGPVAPQFEDSIAAYCGAARGIAVNSATSALHIACLSLDLGPGDSLWTSPNTFVASANCARYCGADVDFVDIDAETLNMSVEALASKLEIAEAQGNLPKVVVPVHFAGQSCDMRGISQLAKRYGFRVIEDASHAIGGKYAGEPVGNCRYSDIAVFSFHPVKIITSGEGGLAVTNNPVLADRMARLRTHGITRDAGLMHSSSEEQWYYEQIELGMNYRLTEIQAALGLSQFARIDDYVARRHAVAARYDEALIDLPLILPHHHSDAHSAYHLYPIQIYTQEATSDRGRIFSELKTQGVGVNVHYIPVHLQPYYQRRGFGVGDFPIAEHYYKRALSIPIYPTITTEQQEKVIQALRRSLM